MFAFLRRKKPVSGPSVEKPKNTPDPSIESVAQEAVEKIHAATISALDQSLRDNKEARTKANVIKEAARVMEARLRKEAMSS